MRDRLPIESSVHRNCQRLVRARLPRCLFPHSLSAPLLWAAIAVCCLGMFSFAGRLGAQQSAATPPATLVNDTPGATSNLPGIKDYLDTSEEPVEVPSLGIMVRDGTATLDGGESMSGAEVVDIAPHSPAAKALGTHEVSHVLVNGALIGAGVASAVLFPPAIVVVAMIAHSNLGRSSDLIVGVDGYRVRNTMDMMQSVADLRPGDTVYMAIVRSGHRFQLPVRVQ